MKTFQWFSNLARRLLHENRGKENLMWYMSNDVLGMMEHAKCTTYSLEEERRLLYYFIPVTTVPGEEILELREAEQHEETD